MRTITFAALVSKVQRQCGLSRVEPNLAASLAEWLEARIAKAIKRHTWPELTPIERRPLRDWWSAGTAYTLGDVVAYETDEGVTYYEAIGYPPAGVVPGTEDAAELWEKTVDFERIVAYHQAGAAPFYDVLNVWRDNPRKAPGARELGFRKLDDGILLPSDAPSTVWIQYRRPAPRFTVTPYDAGRTYTPDDVFYLAATGQVYRPLEVVTGTSPADLPELFEIQAVPFVIAEAAARAAKADFLADDGQTDKAFAQERLAESWIDDEILDETVKQGQAATYRVA